MISRPPEPTRAQIAGRVAREATQVVLAFVAGFGTYFGTLKAPPTTQDYYAAIGAGALLALAKLIPSPGNGRG